MSGFAVGCDEALDDELAQVLVDAEQRKRADQVHVRESVDNELVQHSEARQPEGVHVGKQTSKREQSGVASAAQAQEV